MTSDRSTPPTQLGHDPTDGPGGTPEEREQQARRDAVRRIEKKRAWTASFAAYCVVNAFLVVMWAVTGHGYFWPGWVLGGWGIGEALGYYDAFVRRPISEADIDAEMRRE
jgi:hypothetical protein